MFKWHEAQAAANTCVPMWKGRNFFKELATASCLICQLCGREQFNHVSVWVAEKNLPRAIRPGFAGTKFRASFLQVRLPRIQIVHAQREMIATIPRNHRLNALADQVQFLICAQAKPGAWKRERRARHGLELQ